MHYAPIVFPSPSSLRFEQLIRRIHRQINSAAAQERRRTIIARLPDELLDHWDRLLEQLEVEESVKLIRLEGEAVQLNWRNQHP